MYLQGGIGMALIKCPECGKEISEKAECCIHCGMPLKGNSPSDNTSQDYEKNISRADNLSAFYETKLKCCVCKKIFCVHGDIRKTDGISCPSCNSRHIVLLDSLDVPDTTLNVVSLLFPIVGFILFIVKKDETPIKAKKFGEYALIGFILGLVAYVVLMGF